MSVPEAIRERMRLAEDGPATGASIAREMREQFQDRIVGVYVMPQLGRFRMALSVLDGLGYGDDSS